MTKFTYALTLTVGIFFFGYAHAADTQNSSPRGYMKPITNATGSSSAYVRKKTVDDPEKRRQLEELRKQREARYPRFEKNKKTEKQNTANRGVND